MRRLNHLRRWEVFLLGLFGASEVRTHRPCLVRGLVLSRIAWQLSVKLTDPFLVVAILHLNLF